MNMMFLNKEFPYSANISEEFYNEFHASGKELLTTYNHRNSRRGMECVYSEWKSNKGWIWNLFSGSPHWNGRGQIVVPAEFHREIDTAAIEHFMEWAEDALISIKKPLKAGFFTYAELKRMESVIRDKIYRVENFCDVTINIGLQRELSLLAEDRDRIANAMANIKGKGLFYAGAYYSVDDYEDLSIYHKFMNEFCRVKKEQLATENIVFVINRFYPEVNAVVGQKTSRLINKIMRLIGVDKADGYGTKFATFSDSINPKTFKRIAVLSINPYDFWTMSFGHKWRSCHTIDKDNLRRCPGDGYHGMYCSGTESYMLDGASFVFYTVDDSYKGTEYEKQDKMTRCMFYIGQNKIVQGRLYPQSNDTGAELAYREARELVQKLICEAAGAVNGWETEIGTTACEEVIFSSGTHYRDYESFENCNVSFWKGDDKNYNEIEVGHDPICPYCGEEHEEDGYLTCDDCRAVRCASCGSYVDDDDVIYIDGDPYCRSCVRFCEYYQEYTTDDVYDVYRYGNVSESAIINSGYFVEVEDRMPWYSSYMHIDHVLKTEDGHYYRDRDNMIAAGYDSEGHRVESAGEGVA